MTDDGVRDQVIHVAYPPLVSDPPAAASDVFDAVGIPFDDGYENDDVSSATPIRADCERFAIDPERTQLTST